MVQFISRGLGRGNTAMHLRVADADVADTVLVSASAQLPTDEGTFSVDSGTFRLVLEVDPRTDIIVNAECSCLLELGRDWFRRQVVGKRIVEDEAGLLKPFETLCAFPGRKTIVRGLQNAHNRYREYKGTYRSDHVGARSRS